ncbi:methyltransferase domain-containing protein [Streptomyces sp. NBC_00233]|uniref:methyltransferase domain-containing protein n=1 Tax=Streptomyces sp. NBC_00233 TaxID=2975686 RepID=UPI002257430D|nr:methyltransferase domain-containing protein [Streptomyces sp. NBC_00233]MCX5232372.1 class I SAM-dependent methyltransferase [Streptomyces sp. NBC_00233]
MTTADSTTGSTASPSYWEPLWADGRRYRRPDEAEKQLMAEHLGPGRNRPALDIGSGDGAPARHLHHELGYRTTGIDCAPSAIALAAAHDTDTGTGTGPGSGPA